MKLFNNLLKSLFFTSIILLASCTDNGLSHSEQTTISGDEVSDAEKLVFIHQELTNFSIRDLTSKRIISTNETLTSILKSLSPPKTYKIFHSEDDERIKRTKTLGSNIIIHKKDFDKSKPEDTNIITAIIAYQIARQEKMVEFIKTEKFKSVAPLDKLSKKKITEDIQEEYILRVYQNSQKKIKEKLEESEEATDLLTYRYISGKKDSKAITEAYIKHLEELQPSIFSIFPFNFLIPNPYKGRIARFESYLKGTPV